MAGDLHSAFGMQTKDADGGAATLQLIETTFSPVVPGRARPLAIVIDDDRLTRTLVRDILEPLEWLVEEAADGRQGYKLCASRSPELIITDLVMPEQEGIETIQMLRREFPLVRIIAMSGASGGRFLPAAARLGATAVLHKPFAPGQLISAVAGCMAK